MGDLAGKLVVVTGSSTGIGWGATKILVSKGCHVLGSVRKEADAKRLVSEFGRAFTPLLFDVTDKMAVQAAAVKVGLGSRLPALWPTGGLRESAGLACYVKHSPALE